MAGLNKVQLIGNVGREPEMSVGKASGDPYCRFTLAVREFKDGNVEWFRIVVFKRLAEIAGQFLKKGSQVYIEGRLRTNRWKDKEGQDRSRVEVVAFNLQLLGRKEASSEPASADAVAPPAYPSNDNPFDDDNGFPDITDGDLPF